MTKLNTQNFMYRQSKSILTLNRIYQKYLLKITSHISDMEERH